MHGFRNEFGMTQKFFLFYTRQFTPLLITQFLGAFNDNLFKNVFLVSVIFGTGVELKLLEPKIFITLAAGLFIFPYVLCSSLAGQLADKLEKSKLVLRIKLADDRGGGAGDADIDFIEDQAGDGRATGGHDLDRQ